MPHILSRRRFIATAAYAGAGAAWLGGAGLLLRDDGWTPNRSFWVARGRVAPSPPLRGAATADLLILGAGVTGLSAAIHALLRHPGLDVLLLEAHYAGYGATGRSGGVLGEGTEMGTPEGTADNVPFVLDLIERFGIDCDLRSGTRAEIDPYRYAAGLKRTAVALGARVHEGSRVSRLRHGPTVVAEGEGFEARAGRVVVAVNGYLSRLGIGESRIVPIHTAAAVTVPLPPAVLASLPDEIHVMTSREMYMWGRKAPEGRLLVGAGARYFYGDGLHHRGDDALFAVLRRFLARTYPALPSGPFAHAWTGPMGCTSDQDPIFGRTGENGNVVYAGGYTGHGLAMGTKAGSFLAGWLDGVAPPAWLLRPTLSFPPEPLRYIAVNGAINLMNLGLYSQAKHA
ncbi:MAG: NAD(P)/FAD-dependent oxidoreductase [Candidatus Polarisedimenticolia bacterium]